MILTVEGLSLAAVEDNGAFGWTIQLHDDDGRGVFIKRIPDLGTIDFTRMYRLTLEEVPPRSDADPAD
jgi:hypothetical protein